MTAGLSWDDERVLNFEQLPQADQAKVQAVLAAHDPTKPRSKSPDELKRERLLAKLDDARNDLTVQPNMKAVLAAFKDLYT